MRTIELKCAMFYTFKAGDKTCGTTSTVALSGLKF